MQSYVLKHFIATLAFNRIGIESMPISCHVESNVVSGLVAVNDAHTCKAILS